MKKKNNSIGQFLNNIYRVIVMVVYFPLAIIQMCTPFRFLFIRNQSRIGHLALEVDWFLKKRALGNYANIRPILLFPSYRGAPNEALVAIWSRYIPLISHPVLKALASPLLYFPMLRVETTDAALSVPADYPKLSGFWGDGAPFLLLDDELAAMGEKTLIEMGVPAGAWFVCIHARENVYSPDDAIHNNSRNCDIKNYEGAADEIIARGGWCIRVGEAGARGLTPREGVVNYHDSPFKSDFMDVFLCIKTRFFLGNTSGIYVVSVVAGRPCALANMIPHGCCYGFGSKDISIVKHFQNLLGEPIPLKDIFRSDLSENSYSFLNIKGLSIVENSIEEIRQIAAEMLDVLDGSIQYSKEDESLQSNFRDLLDERHYTYGASGRIGRDFLRSNSDQL